jgi:hypothetical protein
MNTPQSILAGAALIAGTVLFINTIHPAEAQMRGPFQLMHHSNTVSNAGVFRLDTSSGEVSYCFITADSSLTCSAPVK